MQDVLSESGQPWPEATPADAVAGSEGQRSPKAHGAYLLLQQAIREGDFPAGVRLKEVDLARRLGMSRTPIREAIRQLQRDGVVTVVPHRGAVVRGLSEQEIEDTYALRAIIEGYCASRAAERMTAAELDGLAEIHERFEAAVVPDRPIETEQALNELIRTNREFHVAILAGSRNGRATDVLQNATEVPLHMKEVYWRSQQARAGALVNHRAILEALRARDPLRADAVMRTHVYAVKEFFVRQQRELETDDRSTEAPPVERQQ